MSFDDLAMHYQRAQMQLAPCTLPLSYDSRSSSHGHSTSHTLDVPDDECGMRQQFDGTENRRNQYGSWQRPSIVAQQFGDVHQKPELGVNRRKKGRYQSPWDNENSWNASNTWDDNGLNPRRSRQSSLIHYGPDQGRDSKNKLAKSQDPRDIGSLPSRLIPLSRDLAYFLRHRAGNGDFPSLNPQGWMAVRILRTMRFRTLYQVTDEDIQCVVQESYSKHKPRFEVRSNEGELEIRALHNHSLKVAVVPEKHDSAGAPSASMPAPRKTTDSNDALSDNKSAHNNANILPITQCVGLKPREAPMPSNPPLVTVKVEPDRGPQFVSAIEAPLADDTYSDDQAVHLEAAESTVSTEDSQENLPEILAGTQMRVISAFSGGPQYEDFPCLIVEANDVITFLEADGLWSKGRFDSEEGWFPTKFVEPLESEPVTSRLPPPPKAPPPVCSVVPSHERFE
eukprot:GEMP01023361.1.p1 GENE.GEMP01023361.1~~GEMP01023361.1.p1  ORF type:complete len:464 (+),score=98.28 GEMP01023361.1:36-1394(+)